MADIATINAQQDALRPLRQFVGTVSGALTGYENATAYSDWYSYNQPGGYQAIGPYTVSPYGTAGNVPISQTRDGSVVISPGAILFGLGLALALLWK